MSWETEELSPEERVALVARVDASFLLDPQRAKDSLLNHSATELHKRALAAQNGSSVRGGGSSLANLGLRKLDDCQSIP